MCDQQSITCRDCIYVEACFSLNSEMQKHRKDFLDSDLCAKQCTTFKARKDYMPRKQVSTFLRNSRCVFGPLSGAQLDLLSVIEHGLGRCEISRFTDEQLRAVTHANIR